MTDDKIRTILIENGLPGPDRWWQEVMPAFRALVAAAQAEGQRVEVDLEKGCEQDRGELSCPLYTHEYHACNIMLKTAGTPAPSDCPLRKGRVIVERKA